MLSTRCLIGGIGCIVGVGVTVVAFPELAAYEADVEIARMEREKRGRGRLRLTRSGADPLALGAAVC